MTFILLPQVWGVFTVVFKGYDQLLLLAFICAFLDSLWRIFMRKDDFFFLFSLVYYSDYFRVLFSLLTLIFSEDLIFCFSSTFYT